MIGEALFERLTTDPVVNALIGTRMFPLVVPQAGNLSVTRYPCIVYTRGGVERQEKFCGTDTIVRTTVDLDCYATRYDAAHSLAAAVRGALIDFKGTMGTLLVRGCFLATEMDMADPDPGLFRVVQTWTIFHFENP